MPRRYLLTGFVAALLVLQILPASASSEAIDHIVILWLKEPGKRSAQDTIIEASQAGTSPGNGLICCNRAW